MTDETQRLNEDPEGTQRLDDVEAVTERLDDDPGRTQVLRQNQERTERLAAAALSGPSAPEATQPFDVAADNAADSYVSFGPGVPMPAAPARDRATALWRGDVSPSPSPEAVDLARRRRGQRWILPLTVLILVIAVLIYYFWGRGPSTELAVTGVTVQPSATAVSCDGTERLTAEVTTNGGSGTLEYQWLRSDGTVSGKLTQPVAQGSKHVSIVLEWSFEGYGSMDATATFSVLSPGTQRADTAFTYHCVK